MQHKKLVIFGAGKIGRSFIGQVFGQAGYELVFIDVSLPLVEMLNRQHEYTVIVKQDAGDRVIKIDNLKAVHLNDTEQILAELADTSLAAISLGQQGLPAVIPLIAGALKFRYDKYGIMPLDIILAENMRNADAFVIERITPLLPAGFPVQDMLGLVETSIGKMVPIMTSKDLEEDPLQIFAEPYNTLIVAKNAFRNPIPNIKDLAPKENIKAWVDRKLFIHNLGHATLAYLGYHHNPSFKYIWEAAAESGVFQSTMATMMQSAEILSAQYPGEFKPSQLKEHVLDLLNRFQNKELGDTLFRVGCDLFRKLGPEDRFTAPIRAALKLQKPYDLILKAYIAGTSFKVTDEKGKLFPDDSMFFKESEKGIAHLLQNISGLSQHELAVMNISK